MKRTLTVLAGLTGSLVMSSGAMGGIASTQAIVQNISALVGTPAGLQTWAVFIQFDDTTTTLLSHTQWSVEITGGTFFNADSDSPGLVTGNVPVNPLFFPLVGLDFAWDTNISMDNSSVAATSSEEPVMDFTSTYVGGFHIGGGGAGVFNSNPINPVTPGADMMIQVAQLTFSAGVPIVQGTFVALTPSAVAGATPTTISVFIPAPGAVALLGLAGLVGTRRRRA